MRCYKATRMKYYNIIINLKKDYRGAPTGERFYFDEKSEKSAPANCGFSAEKRLDLVENVDIIMENV